MNRYLIPFIIFVGLIVLLAAGLKLDPRKVPSPLINKTAPAFELAQLHSPDKKIKTADMLGQVWLLNVWASWCASCRQEHPLLMALAKTQQVAIYGLNYKDERPAAIKWLEQLGNPYQISAFDAEGKVGIDWGVYGVPETFVIDNKGIIRYKHIGVLTAKIMEQTILPLIRQLKSQQQAGVRD